MVVGVCRLAFALPGVASLKGKRSVVRRIVDRARAKFNVAVAEVAQLDSHKSAVIGFVVVSNDTRHVQSMLDHISAFMGTISEAVVVDRSLEIIHTNGQSTSMPGLGDLDGLSEESWGDDDDS
jgi:uncharacterized protein YlxP (DUF503 family)